MVRDSITLRTFRTLPSSLFLRKGTLVPIPINSLELGAGMVLPPKPRGCVCGSFVYEVSLGVE
jgi:hypothetical protein